MQVDFEKIEAVKQINKVQKNGVREKRRSRLKMNKLGLKVYCNDFV